MTAHDTPSHRPLWHGRLAVLLAREIDAISQALADLCDQVEGARGACVLAHPRLKVHDRELELCEGYMPQAREEFAAGRVAARLALSEWRFDDAILRGSGREPIFPTSVVGSISHSHGCSVAIVAPALAWKGIGIDLEIDETDADEAALAARVASADEHSAMATMAAHGVASPASWIHSAKEAVFKAAFPPTRVSLDYEDVNIRVEGRDRFVVSTAQVDVGPEIVGLSRLGRGWMLTVAALPRRTV